MYVVSILTGKKLDEVQSINHLIINRLIVTDRKLTIQKIADNSIESSKRKR